MRYRQRPQPDKREEIVAERRISRRKRSTPIRSYISPTRKSPLSSILALSRPRILMDLKVPADISRLSGSANMSDPRLRCNAISCIKTIPDMPSTQGPKHNQNMLGASRQRPQRSSPVRINVFHRAHFGGCGIAGSEGSGQSYWPMGSPMSTPIWARLLRCIA